MDVMTAAFALVHDYPGGAVALAPVIGKNPATLSHEVNPNYPTAKLGLDDAVKLSVWTQDRRIASAFASQVGCMLLPLPATERECSGIEALTTMAREFAELIAEAGAALADNRVTPNEIARIQEEAAQLVASVETTLHKLTAMAAAGSKPARKAANA
jgi:hypothetical protein